MKIVVIGGTGLIGTKVVLSASEFSFGELFEIIITFVMKVHLIRKETIEDFVHENARSRPSFEEFMEKLRNGDWENPTDMKKTFSATDLLGRSSNRVVFNIGGNNGNARSVYEAL
jgi:mRNA-degrading endonuclease HigB of HigAB toxin-antitoxin module